MTASYELLYPEQEGYAKIAVCRTFGAAAQAQKDGCHVAIVENNWTKAHAFCLEVATVFGRMSPWLAKPLLAASKHLIFTPLAKGFDRTVEVSRNLVRPVGFGVHTDRLEGVISAIAAAKPTTILYTKLPVRGEGPDWFNQKFLLDDGSVKNIGEVERDSCEESPCLSVKPGAVAVMFEHDYTTIAHSAPDGRPRALTVARAYPKRSY